MNKILAVTVGHAGLAISAALVAVFLGCARQESVRRAGMDGRRDVVQVNVEAQDDFVYYPNYQVYYSSNRHMYRYRDGNSWVTRSSPQGVTVSALFASPSVRMDFHDAPERHHEVVAKTYPKNWKPAPANREAKKDDHKDDGRADTNRHN